MTNNNSLSITYAANSTLTSGSWGYTSASIPTIYYGSTSISPAVVGWEKQLADLELVGEKIIKNSGNFPPYNQIKVDDDNYILELAIAGFSKKDISVYEEKGALIIEGKIEEDENDKTEYVHKGIATRSFTRAFGLGEHVEVNSADYKDGILTIKLVRNLPKEEKARHIAIK